MTFCMFDRHAFERMISDTPHLANRLLEMSFEELDAARDWMLPLGRKTAREKVATVLWIILRRAPVAGRPLRADIPLTRTAADRTPWPGPLPRSDPHRAAQR